MPNNSVRVIDSSLVTVSRTTPKAARRMVSRGIARWRGEAVELIASDPRVSLSRRKSVEFSDGEGMASIEAIKGLPVAGDVVRLLMGKRVPFVNVRPRVVLSVQMSPISVRRVPPAPVRCPGAR